MVGKDSPRNSGISRRKASSLSAAVISVISVFPMFFFSQWMNFVRARLSFKYIFSILASSTGFLMAFRSSVGFFFSTRVCFSATVLYRP